MSELEENKRQLQATVRHPESLLRNAPNDTELLCNKAQSLAHLGNYQEAQKVLRTALYLDPAHQRAKMLFHELRIHQPQEYRQLTPVPGSPSEDTASRGIKSIRTRSRPKLLLIADVPDWVFARHCQTIKNYLQDEFDFTITFQGQPYAEGEFDLIYPLEWALVKPEQIHNPAKYVSAIRSHLYWTEWNFYSFVDFLSAHFHQVHVVSKRLERMFSAFLPSVTYVSHGVDVRFFDPAPRIRPAGARLKIGWAGNRKSRGNKGVSDIIEPLGGLANVELVSCVFREKQLGMDKMRDFYQALDVYICASDFEGNNNSLLEAAAMECAIITTDNGTVPEYLRYGESAFIVERQLPLFLHALRTLQDDPVRRLLMGRNARRAVSQIWDWKRRAEDYRAFFQAALKGQLYQPAADQLNSEPVTRSTILDHLHSTSKAIDPSLTRATEARASSRQVLDCPVQNEQSICPQVRPQMVELPHRSSQDASIKSVQAQKIVHISSHDIIGGAAKVGWRLAEAQRQSGLSAFTLVGRKTISSPYVEAFPLKPDLHITSIAANRGLLDYQFQGSHELVYHPSIKSADIIHLHNLHGSYFNPFSLLLLSRLKPVIWTLHDMQALTGHCAHAFECDRWQQGCGECPDLKVYPAISVDSTKLLWKHKQFIYEHSPLWLVTPSEWLKNKLSKSLLKDTPIELIYNGVDTNVFHRYGKQQSRQKWNIPANSLAVGCVATKGALSNPWKGGEYLLAAFQTLRQTLPNLCLVNIGATQAPDFPGVVHIPPLEDETELAKAYSALDFFLYTSIADNCPLVVLEALACGLPIVTFATGGVPELVRDGQDGFVCRYKDIHSIIEKAFIIAQDVSLRQTMGRNARQHAIAEFDHEVIAAQYEALYRRRIERWQHDPHRSKPISLAGFPGVILTEAFQRSLSCLDENIVEAPVLHHGKPVEESSSQRTANQLALDGFKHFDLGRWELALASFEAALDAAPGKQGIHFLRTQCLDKLGRLEEAKKAVRAELAIQPCHPDALQLLRSLEDKTRESLLSPQTVQQEALALCDKGAEVLQNGRPKEALNFFEEALRLEPGLLGAYYARAVCLEQLGCLGEAEAAVRRELKLQPDHLDSRKLFRTLRSKKNSSGQCGRPSPIIQSASESVNHAVLEKEREFWNVASMYEAMFERVYVDGEVAKLPLEAKIARWNASAEASVNDVLRGIPWDPGWQVLEIGCGVGRLVKPLRERFAQVDGADISEKMVEFSRQYLADAKQNGRVFLNNGCDLQFLADSSYDFVFSMIVFQHIRSISVVRNYFTEIARVLKPGGYFRLQVFEFNPKASRGRFDEEGNPDRQYGFAGNGYTPDQLRNLFLNQGYVIERIEVNTPWIWATVRCPVPLQSTFSDRSSEQAHH